VTDVTQEVRPDPAVREELGSTFALSNPDIPPTSSPTARAAIMK